MPTSDWLEAIKKSHPHKEGVLEVYTRIWRGSFPKLVLDKKVSRDLFYNSYLQTYLDQKEIDFILEDGGTLYGSYEELGA